MKPPVDKTGTPIVPGRWLAYGHAMGRCAGLRIGRVLAIDPAPKRYGEAVDEVRILVIGVDDDWTTHTPPRLCQRVGRLEYPNRTIVLDPARVPETHVRLCEEYVAAVEDK